MSVKISKVTRKVKIGVRICWRLLKNPSALTLSFEDFHFLSDRETLLYLKEKGVGIARFGDGDLGYLVGRFLPYQHYDDMLQKKLAEILTEYGQNGSFLAAMSLDLIFGIGHEKRGTTLERWKTIKYVALPFLKKHHTYGSPFCFRMDNVIDDNKETYKTLLLSLFEGKDIIYVGNVKEFVNILKPVKVIDIPSRHVFSRYNDLLKEIMNTAIRFEYPLVLLVAGATATVLSVDLNKRGILTYDIGTSFLNSSG